MDKQRRIVIAKCCVVLSVIPVLIYAHPAGPDPAKSGAPGESTCSETGCHVGTPLNTGGGGVRIDALGSYTPGVKQRVNVVVGDPGQRRWGFQLTARTAGDSRVRAGVFAPVDNTTQIICAAATLQEVPCTAAPTLQYIEHTTAGARTTAVGAGITFEFDWTPPASDVGDVIFYAAGNASNSNTLETGDRIYTATLRVNPSGGTKPVISKIEHGASFQPGFAPNSWVTIKGTDLATNTRVWEGPDFKGNLLPTNLDGTTVKINDKFGFVYFISPTQLNVLSPVEVPQGNASIQVNFKSGASDSATAPLEPLAPAFFLFNNDKYITARHEDFSLLGPTTLFPGLTTPAKPGEVLLLFGTGFGPTDPQPINGQLLAGAPRTTSPVTVKIGGVDVTPSFAGLSATGLYQVNVRVPDSAPNGDVPVVATIGGVSSPANAFISVQR